MTQFDFLTWSLAFSPILVVLCLMIIFNWSGSRAGAAGWFTALLVAFVFFGADTRLIIFSQARAILLAINVLYIIWPALLHYHVVNEIGGIEAIGKGVQQYSSDGTIQILIFGWVFSSFLQGVAGYGVPIAVVAPLLFALGFSPIVCVAVPAIGHSWSVTFGSMGASFQALMAVTGLGYPYLASSCAILLGVCTFLCGMLCVHVYGGLKAVRHALPALALMGSAMSLTQYILAVSGLWTLGGFGASIAGMAAGLLAARMRRYSGQPKADILPGTSLFWSVSAYVVLIVIICAGVMIDPVKSFLGQAKLSLYFPSLVSDLGHEVPAGTGKSINIFGHSGALLCYATMTSFLIFKIRGYYAPGSLKMILAKTAKSGVPTSLGILTMVCFALIMDHCGMIVTLARGVSSVFGGIYPLVSPWIGLLGAFMTGSNTNSNVVFGVFQQNTAQLAGVSMALILAAQTTGGALGSMIAPAKLIVGCSTVGLSGKEGPVLKITLRYGIAITLIVGLITLGAAVL